MKVTIYPSKLKGNIPARASKSQAHRLLICGALFGNPCTIFCDSISEDISATVDCLNSLGADIKYDGEKFLVNPIKSPKKETVLNCRESGSTLRFMIPIVATLGTNSTFKMSGRLPKRPLSPLDKLLEENGVSLSRPSADTLKVCGKLEGGDFLLDGGVSSQFASGLLFSLPLFDKNSTLKLTGNIQSVNYINMTVEAIGKFGFKVEQKDNKYSVSGRTNNLDNEFFVEGDWSNGAFWVCAQKLSGGIAYSNLDINSQQGDKEILEISSHLTSDGLGAIVIDASNIPDLVPIICVTASSTQGAVTTIKNASRLKLKESDRIKSTAQMINSLGGKAIETDDGLIITGTGRLLGGKVDSFNDHRIAMSAAIASLICDGPVEISGAQAVNKSYPDFWKDFQSLGGKIEIEN